MGTQPIWMSRAADIEVWRTFPRTVAWTFCAFVGLFVGWSSAFTLALFVYCGLALLRTTVPFGSNLQVMLRDLFTLTTGPLGELPVWFVLSIQMAMALKIAWPFALVLAVILWVLTLLADMAVRAFLPMRNPYNL